MSLKAIFREGMKERKRRKSLGKISGEFKEKEKAFAAQLMALGQKAWETKSGISAYPELQAALLEAQKTLDDLRAQGQGLQQQKQEAEDERKREAERLGSAIREWEEKKRGIDSRLGEQKSALQAGQKETQRAASRLAAIAQERTQLQNKAMNPASPEAEKSEIAKGMASLAAEEAELQGANRAREEAGKPVAAAIAVLQEEAAQAQKTLEGQRGDLKKITGDLDKRIVALNSDLANNGEKIKENESRQKLSFRALGEKLAAAQGVQPDIAKEMAAVLSARTEKEGVQSLIDGLERQKDEGQVSAYKKMLAILIGGVILLAAIVIALFLLLSPKKKATPLEGLLGRQGTAVQGLGELAQQMNQGFAGVKTASEKIQGGTITIAAEGAMKSALPSVSGWQTQNPYYNRGTYNNLEIASLQADYAGPGGDSIRVQITDAGTASALLAPLKMVISIGIRVDDADVMQQMSTVNGIAVVERIDKRDGEATLGIIHKDRYLVELKTRAASGLETLRQFAAKIDLSRLP